MINPDPQVAVDEQLLPQECHQILQGPAKGRFQLQVLEQQPAINAAQIRVFGASDEVPTNVLIRTAGKNKSPGCATARWAGAVPRDRQMKPRRAFGAAKLRPVERAWRTDQSR